MLKLNMKHLPLDGKFTDVLKVAMVDLEAAEEAPDVVVDMANWHFREMEWNSEGEYVPVGPCLVCFAGSVMRGMGVPDNHPDSFLPDKLPEEITIILNALDNFRSGDFNYMAERVRRVFPDFVLPKNMSTGEYIAYGRNPEEWKKWAYDKIAKLEAAGQ